MKYQDLFPSDLFETLHRDDEQRGTPLSGRERRQLAADELQRRLHTLVAHPEQEVYLCRTAGRPQGEGAVYPRLERKPA